jgi:hypothetical protein
MLTMGSALIATRTRSDPPAPPPVVADQHVPPVGGLDQVLTALGQAATPAATTRSPDRRSLSVVVTRGPGGCRVSAVAVTARPDAVSPRRPPGGRLTVAPTDPPLSAAAQAGCASADLEGPGAGGPALFDGRTGDLGGSWNALAAADDRLARSPGPLAAAVTLRQIVAGLGPALDAGTLDAALGKLCLNYAVDCAAFTWTVVAQLVSDPTVGPGRRLVALRQARTAGPVTTVPAVRADLTGRAGVTLRVPYLRLDPSGVAGSARVTAELTVDPRTGTTLQIVVRDAAGDRTETLVLEP